MRTSAAALELDFTEPSITAAKAVADTIARNGSLQRDTLLWVMKQAYGGSAPSAVVVIVTLPRSTPTAPFFWQPNTEHVSAVLFSNAGTISKFNRMGVRAGFGDRFVSLVRRGGLNDPSPGALDAIAFDLDIEHPDYEEDWADELCMYHNPNALLPIDEDLFPGITHYRIEEGEAIWRGPAPRVLFSRTTTVDFIGREGRAELKAAGKSDITLGRDGR